MFLNFIPLFICFHWFAEVTDACFVHFCPLDTCISSLLEAALSGNEEQKPFDCTLHPDLSVLVDLALGSSKEPANSLWINMQDYAISKGLPLDSAYNELDWLFAREKSKCQRTDCTVYSVADWDNASLSNESLLDTVSRFVLAALLKHTGLQGQACGEGRYCNTIFCTSVFIPSHT